jgi:hypothetical protein
MKKLINLSLIAFLLITNCKKGSDEPKEVLPFTPDKLEAVQISSSQINLSWEDKSTNERGFKIERKTSTGTFQLIGSVGTNTTNYSDRAGLQAGIVYIYRVYAYNSAGNSVDFSNEAKVGVPDIVGISISQVKASSAMGDAAIAADYGSAITAKGWVWSTNPNPTVNLTTKTNDGTGIGRFTSNITGLSFNTTYYLRPYATNLVGTAYGSEIVIKTEVAETVAGGKGVGSTADKLSSPRDIFVDATDNIYVVDRDNDRIQKWTPGATSGITVAGGNGRGSAANQLSLPYGVYVDGSGNIYVADAGNHRIQKWTPGTASGVTVAGGNGEGRAANQLAGPGDVFIDLSGNLYVSDTGNSRIQKWIPGAVSGVTVAGGNGEGSAANQLKSPMGLFVDASGNTYVADNSNHRIQKWIPGAASGVTVAGGSLGGNASSQLVNPWDVFLDQSGNIFVADLFNHRIQKWVSGAASGITVAGGNGFGSAVNQLYLPGGVFVDNKGYIYVADFGNHRVQKWAQ